MSNERDLCDSAQFQDAETEAQKTPPSTCRGQHSPPNLYPKSFRLLQVASPTCLDVGGKDAQHRGWTPLLGAGQRSTEA